jgi:hypothetical protein
VTYWEGLIDVAGTTWADRAATGRGYLEMTGYAGSMGRVLSTVRATSRPAACGLAFTGRDSSFGNSSQLPSPGTGPRPCGWPHGLNDALDGPMTNHEVISAFLDNEPFDVRELGDALADPNGRELLIDLIALREIVQPEPAIVPAPARSRTAVRVAVAAAGLVLAMGIGYQIGTAADSVATAPPEPTRVVVSDEPWRDAQ